MPGFDRFKILSCHFIIFCLACSTSLYPLDSSVEKLKKEKPYLFDETKNKKQKPRENTSTSSGCLNSSYARVKSLINISTFIAGVYKINNAYREIYYILQPVESSSKPLAWFFGKDAATSVDNFSNHFTFAKRTGSIIIELMLYRFIAQCVAYSGSCVVSVASSIIR